MTDPTLEHLLDAYGDAERMVDRNLKSEVGTYIETCGNRSAARAAIVAHFDTVRQGIQPSEIFEVGVSVRDEDGEHKGVRRKSGPSSVPAFTQQDVEDSSAAIIERIAIELGDLPAFPITNDATYRRLPATDLREIERAQIVFWLIGKARAQRIAATLPKEDAS